MMFFLATCYSNANLLLTTFLLFSSWFINSNTSLTNLGFFFPSGLSSDSDQNLLDIPQLVVQFLI